MARTYKTVAALLRSRKRWTKYYLHKETPAGTAYCLLGAIHKVYGYTDNNFPGAPIREKLSATIQTLFPRRVGPGTVTHFNDMRRTTHADVLKVVRKARV